MGIPMGWSAIWVNMPRRDYVFGRPREIWELVGFWAVGMLEVVFDRGDATFT